ncbi:hypothetical protein CPB83DRAFT_900850 [Crepidotus variabilis]|uniref:Uncharacterized protein n=1 Tax=Crepidotus variabilis TaxID=179855 RepID=A0A9P6BBE7_9AGAR|nr:hypothetical protein CPB83DRAFT_900850 [Crepidotus variabilis]
MDPSDLSTVEKSLDIFRSHASNCLIRGVFYGVYNSKPQLVFVPSLTERPPTHRNEVDNLVWTEQNNTRCTVDPLDECVSIHADLDPMEC